MSETKCSCACNYKKCCQGCSYPDMTKVPPLEYDYWWQTTWNNWNTTDGWGPFPSSQSGQNNNTFDNLSGYGTSAPASTNNQAFFPYCTPVERDLLRRANKPLPNGKKLKRLYKYQNRFYDSGSSLVYENNEWIPVAYAQGTEKQFRIVSV